MIYHEIWTSQSMSNVQLFCLPFISLSIKPISQSKFIQLCVIQPKTQVTVELKHYKNQPHYSSSTSATRKKMSEISHRDAEYLCNFGEEQCPVAGQVERPRGITYTTGWETCTQLSCRDLKKQLIIHHHLNLTGPIYNSIGLQLQLDRTSNKSHHENWAPKSDVEIKSTLQIEGK